MRLTIQQAAEWAGVSDWTLLRAIHSGTLDAFKHPTWHPDDCYQEGYHGWHYTVELSDVYLWLERHYSRRPTKRPWSNELKLELLEHAAAGKPLKDFAAQYGKTYQSVTTMHSRLRKSRRPKEAV